MSNTHINVYFRNVQDAEEALALAKGNLETAKAELKAKKVELDYEEPTEEKPVEEKAETAKKK